MLPDMTRPKRGAGPIKGSKGRSQQSRRNAPQGRDGTTRDSVRPVRETREERAARTGTGSETQATSARAPAQPGSRAARGTGGRGSEVGLRGEGFRFGSGSKRPAPPKVAGSKKPLPELKRVQLDAPAPDTTFRDLDGERLSFPESNLKRVAARILTEKNKPWRYRPFAFPLFTDRGHEQSFHFDFYVYDPEGSVIRLILVVPHESREVWDRVGRFKRQYPMYTYELWTPEKLAQFQSPRGKLGW
ncbi:hypothetical protein SAMN04488058_10375 [Deinococcus reticulitermitis]|uniref:Uncharacterized protein n=2 Tax=Deinococcus reticulitermitis TaxID=856736 RepID=A0A1H6V7H2_9DEIO|nr:hypothetical protein SAMN04488058_10375 [Deinococcus reticulitermitis]